MLQLEPTLRCFFLLDSIPLYGYPVFHLLIGICGFHLLTILHNIARNINVQVFGIYFSKHTYSSSVTQQEPLPQSLFLSGTVVNPKSTKGTCIQKKPDARGPSCRCF